MCLSACVFGGMLELSLLAAAAPCDGKTRDLLL